MSHSVNKLLIVQKISATTTHVTHEKHKWFTWWHLTAVSKYKHDICLVNVSAAATLQQLSIHECCLLLTVALHLVTKGADKSTVIKSTLQKML